MMDQNDDYALLAASRDGDREAFASLYALHQRRVNSIALNFFGGDADRAAEVVQRVFVKLFGNPTAFRGDSQFTTWIYRVTVNACIDERRRFSRFFGLEDYFGLAETKPGPDDRFDRREVAIQVRSAIATLRPRYRLPLILKYVEDLSYREISEVLDISVGTVSSRLNRGHSMLAKKLAHLRGEI